MMLANTEEVEIDAVSDLDFLKEASHPIGTRGHFSGCGIWKEASEAVDTNVHGNCVSSLSEVSAMLVDRLEGGEGSVKFDPSTDPRPYQLRNRSFPVTRLGF